MLHLSLSPLSQDGSCNGLQHYAALGRDVIGATSVNLIPCEVPQDVYSGVAQQVSQPGHQRAQWAGVLVNAGVVESPFPYHLIQMGWVKCGRHISVECIVVNPFPLYCSNNTNCQNSLAVMPKFMFYLSSYVLDECLTLLSFFIHLLGWLDSY